MLDLRRLRLGWEHIPWYTITDSFDVDFGVGEYHGTNAFIRDGERVLRRASRTSGGATTTATPPRSRGRGSGRDVAGGAGVMPISRRRGDRPGPPRLRGG